MFDFSSNFFELFGLPVAFELDAGLLQTRYRDVQRNVHPDRFATATEQEKRIALQYATRVNEAYQTLRQPLSRARYLLELRGVDTTADASVHDAAFLMQQMELREALAEVRSATDPLAEIDAQMRSITGLRKELLEGLAGLFAADDADASGSALDAVRKLQFVDKLLAEAEALEAEIEDNN